MSVFDAYIRLEGTVSGRVRCDEDMARHTTYRIGGPAALFVECATIADLALTCEVLHEEGVPWTIIGKGSNLLVSDDGYDGAVLVLTGEFSEIDFGDLANMKAEQIAALDPENSYTVTAGAGSSLARLVQQAYSLGLAGLEPCVGIPGTLGGALYMNAGTRGTWIGARVISLTVYKLGEGLKGIRGDDVDWSYRSSGLPEDEIIVEATLALELRDKEEIFENMQRRLEMRKENQPLSTCNCGSVFKNPPGQSAGQLISSCGLAGANCGDAQISELHANFIINNGSATASEVVALMRLARDRVKERHGIRLSPEVKFLGISL